MFLQYMRLLYKRFIGVDKYDNQITFDLIIIKSDYNQTNLIISIHLIYIYILKKIGYWLLISFLKSYNR